MLLRSLEFCESDYEPTDNNDEEAKYNYHSSTHQTYFYFTIE